MTPDDILRMAIEAGAEEYGPLTRNWTFKQHHLERFFRLAYAAGAAAEREECAKVCEAWAKDHAEAASSPGDECDYTNCDLVAAAEDCAAAIRARGKT